MPEDPLIKLSLDMCFRRSSALSEKRVAGEILLLDTNQEEIHQLNATAGLIWESCDGSTTLGEIIRSVMHRFSVAEEIVAHDVKQTLEHFLSHNLICTIRRAG